jgi:hypothetical protein
MRARTAARHHRPRSAKDGVRCVDWIEDETDFLGLEKNMPFIKQHIHKNGHWDETWVISLGANSSAIPTAPCIR